MIAGVAMVSVLFLMAGVLGGEWKNRDLKPILFSSLVVNFLFLFFSWLEKI